MVWAVDLVGFLLLCVGTKLAMPRGLRVLCTIGVVYLLAFAICYYFWLAAQFRYFRDHPHFFQTGIGMAFKFEGFWKLFGNMVLLQGILPIVVVITLYLAWKWLSVGLLPTSSRR
jgi:hypothetical protein